jgi:dihydrofolate synthase/folylpolyglutamate synthase
VENVSLAWSVVDVLRSQGHVISDDAVREGTAATRWPGRFQILSGDPPLVLDGAHNPGAVAVLRRTWDEVFGRGPERIIFGCLAEKLDPEVTRPFLSNDAEIWLVPIGSGRTASREELEALWPGRTVRWFSSSDEAMVRCVEDPKKGGTLVYGSLYLVGEILARNGEGRRETKLNG